jgi:hypothetical protein
MSRRTAAYLAVIFVAGVLIYALGVTLNYHRYSDDVMEELMYFPSGKLLKLVSAGYETLVADMLWLRGIQYYGEHRRTDMSYPLAEHIFSTITDLDPSFIGAYRFGAFVLGQDVGQPVSGIKLIKKGMANNPETWQLAFDLGFLYFVEMDDSRAAARYFSYSARQKDAPAIAKRFSAFAYRKAGRTDVARALWQEIYRSSDNTVMKATAEYALRSILREEISDSLETTARAFESSQGRRPTALRELVTAGLISRVPDDPLGGVFFIDPGGGAVLSTSAVREASDRNRRYIERLLERYRRRFGRFPDRLGDLEASGLVDSLPSVPGTTLRYDPQQGAVEFAVNKEGR